MCFTSYRRVLPIGVNREYCEFDDVACWLGWLIGSIDNGGGGGMDLCVSLTSLLAIFGICRKKLPCTIINGKV